jgi:hypothetical protein
VTCPDVEDGRDPPRRRSGAWSSKLRVAALVVVLYAIWAAFMSPASGRGFIVELVRAEGTVEVHGPPPQASELSLVVVRLGDDGSRETVARLPLRHGYAPDGTRADADSAVRRFRYSVAFGLHGWEARRSGLSDAVARLFNEGRAVRRLWRPEEYRLLVVASGNATVEPHHYPLSALDWEGNDFLVRVL